MYEPSRHVTTFQVAGFQHHDGALVLEQMKAGAKLDLVPERDNPHDPDAIALYFGGAKIGYIPRSETGMMSVMDYYGHGGVFEARVLQVDREADPWRQVRAGIYITDGR